MVLDRVPLLGKVLVPLVVGSLAGLLVVLFAYHGIDSVAGSAHRLYVHDTKGLADLAALRDAEGDARVQIRDAVTATTPAAEKSARGGITEADGAADDAVTAFTADAGATLTAQQRSLLTDFRGKLAAWRAVRDQQVLPAVDAHHTEAATAALAGPLTEADDAYAQPLDALFESVTTSAGHEEVAARHTRDTALLELVLVGLAGAVVAGGVAVVVARRVVGPIRAVSHVVAGLSGGDLTRSTGVRSRDEVGVMAGELDAATGRLRETVSVVAGSAQALAGASDELATLSGRIAGSAEDASSQAGGMSATAETVSRNVQTVAAGSEEMTASIREIAENAAQAARVAQEAVDAASAANATVGQLGASSTEIGNVVKLITSIAEQTNLLALNATIEAARAGEAGKGFAVVANEVKELAQQTAAATGDISARVAAIQADSTEAMEAIGRIGQVIGRINDYQTTIASAVEEQTATTNEMASHVAEAAAGTGEIAARSGAVAGAARATTEGVAGTSQAAGELARMSSELQQLVGQFTV